MKEKIIETKKFIPQLTAEHYDYREDIKTYEALEENFWKHMERLNGPLSVSEKKRIYEKMQLRKIANNKNGVRNAFKIMYSEEGFEIPRDNGDILNIILKDEKHPENNIYEVVNQVEIDDDRKKECNRLDVLTLVNGLPRGWFEMKSTNITINTAINQLIDYHAHSMYGLLNYVTILGVSNDIYTRYTVNNETIEKDKFWKWKKENSNDNINDIAEFSSSFLRPSVFSEFLDNCVFVKYGKIKDLNVSDPKIKDLKSLFADKKVVNICLKGYQYRAYKASYNEMVHNKSNAVCWLHMGSGKTLISLMVFNALKRAGKRVVLLVDRDQLHSQSYREYVAFDPFVAENDKKISKLLDSEKSFIATIQGFSRALKNKETLEIAKKKGKDIFFLQDEVQRTQGEMRLSIEKAFPESRWCGFTGTPLLEKYQIQQETQKLTLELFHVNKFTYTYKMYNALEDRETTKIRVEEHLVSPIKDLTLKEEDYAAIDESNEEASGLSKKIKEDFAERGRIEIIDNDILKTLPVKCIMNPHSKKLSFCAQLMTINLNCANLHYHTLLKLIKKHSYNYKIAILGEPGPNVEYEDPFKKGAVIYKTDLIKSWMDTYNEQFELSGQDEFDPSQYKKYEADVLRRLENGEIDLVITASKLSAGYDNPLENTVFFDKPLSHSSLLQAAARATRLHTGKEFAHAISYIPFFTNFDEALRLYNKDADLSEYIIRESYKEAVQHFKNKVKKVLKLAETPRDASEITEKEERKEFAKTFYDMYRYYQIIRTYIEYEFNEEDFGISKDYIEDFKGIIRHWTERDDHNSISKDDFELEYEIIDDGIYKEVDASYIRKLISSIIAISSLTQKEKEIEKIIKLINESDNPIIIEQKEILFRCLEEAKKAVTIEDYETQMELVIEDMKEREILKFAKDNKIDPDKTKAFVKNAIENNNISNSNIGVFTNDILIHRNSESGIFRVKNKFNNDLKLLIEKLKGKYSMCY